MVYNGLIYTSLNCVLLLKCILGDLCLHMFLFLLIKHQATLVNTEHTTYHSVM